MERDVPLPNDEPQGDCASLVIFIGLLAWIIFVALAGILAALLQPLSPEDTSAAARVAVPLIQSALISIPAAIPALTWRNLRYRAVFRTWALAGLFPLVLAPALILEPTAFAVQSLFRTGLALGYVALVWLLTAMTLRGRRLEPASGAWLRPYGRLPVLLAPLLGALSAYPWLAWGALGSPLDLLLALLTALAFGAAAGVLLERSLFEPLAGFAGGSRGDLVLPAFGAAGALAIQAAGAGFPFGGMQLLLLFVLPSFAWAFTALRWLGGRTLALGLLAALLVAAPLALIDPDELVLVINASPGELLQWAASAAGISLLIGWLTGLLLAGLAVQSVRSAARAGQMATNRSSLPRWLAPTLGLLLAAAVGFGIWVHATAGQPGFWGERLFVILEEQADLSPALEIEGWEGRRQWVYDTLVTQASASQADLRADLERFNIAYTPYYLQNSLEVEGGPLLRLWLEARPEVARVLLSPRMRPLPEIPEPVSGSARAPDAVPWNLELIRADQVWSELGVTGEGIVIGQSDSGVDGAHSELAAGYRGQGGDNDYNWFDPWYGTRQPVDLGGHGTHTLGIVLGESVGVAPGATWFGCVNLARNLGNPALYLDCLQFMLAPFPLGGDPFVDGVPDLGAHITNNSWGCPEFEGCDAGALLQAVEALRIAGTFVVASAGNEGPACGSLNDPPALYDGAYAVGAIDSLGQLTFFSSRGPVPFEGYTEVKPDLVAPGEGVLSAFPNNTFMFLDGTSMAGPHVAGVVALMWSANPDLIGNVELTEQILNETARPYSGARPDCPGAQELPSTAVGYGIVDAYAAVQAALEAGVTVDSGE